MTSIKKLLLLGASLLLPIGSAASQSVDTPALKPSAEYGRDAVSPRFKSVAGKQKFAVVGDMLYHLDEKNEVVWSWSNGYGTGLSDNILVDPSGHIFITGDDNLLASVDLKTGKEIWTETINGTAPRELIGLYGTDKYVVVSSYWYYRNYFKDRYHRSMGDRLRIRRDNEDLWKTEIPGDATVTVKGSDIIVSYKRKGRRKVLKLNVPLKIRR